MEGMRHPDNPHGRLGQVCRGGHEAPRQSTQEARTGLPWLLAHALPVATCAPSQWGHEHHPSGDMRTIPVATCAPSGDKRTNPVATCAPSQEDQKGGARAA